MYFIIFDSGDFYDFLSADKMLYKETKQGMLNHYMLLWA